MKLTKKVALSLILFIIFSQNSCSIFTSSRFDKVALPFSTQANSFTEISEIQPGNLLKVYLNSNKLELSAVNLRHSLEQAKVSTKQVYKLANKYPSHFVELFNEASKSNSPNDLAKILNRNISEKPKSANIYLDIMLGLYPIISYRIAASLVDEDTKNNELVKKYLAKRKHLAKLILPRQEKLEQTFTVTPLIHSISLTLYNKSPNQRISFVVENGKTGEFLQAPLFFEPIQGALSGSVFNLEANTEYRLLIRDDTKDDNARPTFLANVKTRPNKPPIDPEKVVYLKDVYSKGQLNVEQLGIEGSADGWAKIDGTGVVIQANELAAIDIGSLSYIYFENLTVVGGLRHGIVSDKAHHLWFNKCNISAWGRNTKSLRGGIAYDSSESTRPINYDAAFALKRTGVVVIENCEVHSPNGTANSWEFGHPMGPTAVLVNADHPNDKYDGQYIVRNNRLYGSQYKRFNDVIESVSNGRVWGGFVRDSAIYNNYLAYANDDAIEIDGGQHNVAVYNNSISHSFVGVSAIPNMMGPSYIVGNIIQNLGDQRGKSFIPIKLGGLLTRPAGLVIVERNETARKNSYSGARFQGDRSYWLSLPEK